MAIYRTKLLNLLVAALRAYKPLDQVTIYSPGDWPTDPEKGSAIQVGRYIHEQKASVTRGQPEFTTTLNITVDARTVATTGEEVLRDIEKLGWKIEQAVLTDYNLNLNLQQFVSVETKQEIDSTTELHVAQTTIMFGLEFFQSQEEYYMPTDPTTITSIDIVIDSANIYDGTGTYTNTVVTEEFPAAIIPAPRTSGPDGRAEGYTVLDVNSD